MPGLSPEHTVMLDAVLDRDFIPHLPPLIDQSKPSDELLKKNRSRAFGAFALRHLCGISAQEAAQSVVDDFDDYGVDAIYYHAPVQTLYLVQSKKKNSEDFSQGEALAFCQGVSKLIRGELDDFNSHAQTRRTDIEGALEECNQIQLVIAHTGSGVSAHAAAALKELLASDEHGEERLTADLLDYDAGRTVSALQGEHAHPQVNTTLFLYHSQKVGEPRETYFGLVRLSDLVSLHETHKVALYERNIRGFLGQKTEVNTSIQRTLATAPENFLYLNNGVTALCGILEPKDSAGGRKRFKIRGLSIINGAQTIASSADFVARNPTADISSARVSFTLIKAPSDGEFGKQVTRARNHQNPVLLSNFAALDDEQERLRREVAHLGLRYVYKAEGASAPGDSERIGIEEAAHALALLQSDPRFVIWLKKEPGRLLDTASDQYKALFNPHVTAFQLVNAVRFNRYIQTRTATEARGVTTGPERLTYKHGNHGLAWMLAKRLRKAISRAEPIDDARLQSALSVPFDAARHALWTHTQAQLGFKGPLALFRSQTDVVPLLQGLAIEQYGLAADPAVVALRAQSAAGEPYPIKLFDYLTSHAPQIEV
ncbi:MAG: AIPR family protein [Dehalococcoidia bacterium]